jgi:hypothetical protein
MVRILRFLTRALEEHTQGFYSTFPPLLMQHLHAFYKVVWFLLKQGAFKTLLQQFSRFPLASWVTKSAVTR